MTYFVFQGNPDNFDIDSYVLEAANSNQKVRWLVSRFGDNIKVGDTVFLWRASGKETKAIAGAIAVCQVIASPKLLPIDDLSKKHWKDKTKLGIQLRADLQIKKVNLGTGEVVSRDSLKNDQVFENATIIKIPNGTNFVLNEAQGRKLLSLLSSANKTWSGSSLPPSEFDYWLVLEKSDETRVSKGIEGYGDQTGETYNYDSLVPNHKNLKVRDRIVLRKENYIVGVGTITKIERFESAKLHMRCPSCTSTDIRERKNKRPKWKCGKCTDEFEIPTETIADVDEYQAEISDFVEIREAPEVRAVKMCAASKDGIKSQHSILKLDERKITSLIKFPGIGFGPEFVEESIQQQQEKFERAVSESKSDSHEKRKERLSSASKKPAVIYSVSKTYRRNPDVVVEVLERANGICEACEKRAPFDRRSDGSPYLEVHHKMLLANGGEDTVDNALAVCPNCHREAHFG